MTLKLRVPRVLVAYVRSYRICTVFTSYKIARSSKSIGLQSPIFGIEPEHRIAIKAAADFPASSEVASYHYRIYLNDIRQVLWT